MLASRQTSWELMWWALVAFLALMLVAVAWHTPAFGEPYVAPIPQGPAPPVDKEPMLERACPAVAAFRAGNLTDAQREFDAMTRQIRDDQRPLETDAAMQVWRTLLAQARGDTAAAIRGWKDAELEPPAEIWRHVGLAAAWLDRGSMDEAARALDSAWELDKDNAIVRYYFALLHLERAHRSPDWIDAKQSPFRLAAAGRPMVVPNSASMYRLAAIGDLERALEEAPNVAMAVTLVSREQTKVPELSPMVGDLLQAIGAKRFEANSHTTLGQLFLEGDNLELAESHFDEAAALGTTAPYGYQEVARGYERQLRYCAAARASGKSFLANPQPTTAKETTANVLRGLGQLMAH
jgi:tetratricopeptide (TPR) repeat protein